MIEIMGASSTATMTFEEFERLPDDAGEFELLEGELIRMPPPEADHMEACEDLFTLLRAAVDNLRAAGGAVGKVHIEMGYLMPPQRSWLRPDLSVTHPTQQRDRFYMGSPMIAIEVVSPNDSAAGLEQKVRVFLANGALEVWIIYPQSRDARVYEASGASRLEGAAVRSRLLPGIEIPFDAFLPPA